MSDNLLAGPYQQRLSPFWGGSNCGEMKERKFYCFDGESKLLYASQAFEKHKTMCINFLLFGLDFDLFCCNGYTFLEEFPSKKVVSRRWPFAWGRFLRGTLSSTSISTRTGTGALFSEMASPLYSDLMTISSHDVGFETGAYLSFPILLWSTGGQMAAYVLSIRQLGVTGC